MALRNDGVQTIPLRTLVQFRVDTVCLSEVRIPDNIKSVVTVPESTNLYHICHSGITESIGHQGVAIALSQASFLGIDILKTDESYFVVLTVYVSTLNTDDVAKDPFLMQG